MVQSTLLGYQRYREEWVTIGSNSKSSGCGRPMAAKIPPNWSCLRSYQEVWRRSSKSVCRRSGLVWVCGDLPLAAGFSYRARIYSVPPAWATVSCRRSTSFQLSDHNPTRSADRATCMGTSSASSSASSGWSMELRALLRLRNRRWLRYGTCRSSSSQDSFRDWLGASLAW